MSGPKTSHLNLTPEQREALRQQRLIRAELAVLKKQLRDVHTVVVQTDAIIAKLEPILIEAEDNDTLNQARELRCSTMDALNQAEEMNESTGLAPIQAMNLEIRQMLQYLESVSGALDAGYENALDTFRTKSDSQIARGFCLDFSKIQPKPTNNPLLDRILAELDAVSCLKLNSVQLQGLSVLRERAMHIQDQTFLKNYYAVTITPFLKSCVAYQESWRRDGAEYERKRLLLEENARELGIEAPEIPFGDGAIAQLDAQLKITDDAIAAREEQVYISRCVDEAMREMGYDLLGSRDITRRSGKKFHNELYLFEEGTAVNVTYSGDGQISMELGGICREDRIPTGAESAALAEDMHAFCDDYAQLEQLLRKKGVTTRRISLLPPDARYAQMINISDYRLEADPEEFQLRNRTQQTEELKHRTAGEY